MQIMHSYSDMLREIEILKDQIDITNKEIDLWFIDGNYAEKYGVNSSIKQVDKLIASRNRLYERLKHLNRAKGRAEKIIETFEGAEYKIAYFRIVECLTHKEIAHMLGYEEQTVRKKWMDMKNQQIVNRQA